MSFYRESMNNTLLKSIDVSSNDEIVEVAKLVQSTKGQINQLRLYVITDGLTESDAAGAAVESDDGEYIIGCRMPEDSEAIKDYVSKNYCE